MLDKWFLKELEDLFTKTDRVVLIDQNQAYDWLLDRINSELDAKVFKVIDYIDDFEVKYNVEKEYRDQNVLIHSYFDPAKIEDRYYMIQEYASVGEKFKQQLSRYISQCSGLQDSDVKLSPEELVLAGKMSCQRENNNQEYWNRIKFNGKQAILGEFNRMVLRFLSEPEQTINQLSQTGKKLFYQLISQYIEFTPDNKPPTTVANELSQAIFDNIIFANSDTKEIYRTWVDSHSYRDSLLEYLEDYELPADFDIWQVDTNHPFQELDKKWLEKISERAFVDEEIPDKMIDTIKSRVRAKEGLEITGNYYWKAILELLTFNAKPAHKIEDLIDFIELYKHKLYRLDQAQRDIYEHFLDQKRIRQGFKAIYTMQIKPYLDRWFELFNNYRENQTDYLNQEIFSKAQNNVAVIIGDAIRFEVAQEIAETLDNDDYEITNSIFKGNYPSTTMNNMSSLFGSIITNSRKKREDSLAEELDTELTVAELDQLDVENIDANQPTIIYSSDIDKLSEEGNEAALKYYQTFVDSVIDKIEALLEAGFAEVHLVTDHGFVYNFDIEEADKFIAPVDGKKRDRFILANQEVEVDNFIKVKKDYEGYNYIYFPKGINPIKSRGKYGFAHEGITPQEVLLPHLKVTKKSESSLEVKIANKDQLAEINSNNLNLKIEAEEGLDLFNQVREVIVQVLDNTENKLFSQKLEISPGERRSFNLSIDSNKFTILVLDAVTKQRLDVLKGEKVNLRSGLDGFDLD